MAKKTTNSGITAEDLKSMSKAFNGKRVNQIASNASYRSGIAAAASEYKAVNALPFTFSVDLKQGNITDQQNSGRCWIFAALNTFRYEIMKKFNLETFELSQNYIFFYDKLEKANFFLNNIIRTKDEPIDGRLFAFLSLDPLCDGGQWDMVSNIVDKYGVVPSYAYPDSKNAESSTRLNEYLTSLLREDGATLRKMARSGKSASQLDKTRKEMMSEIYKVLCISLGEPPEDIRPHLKGQGR